MSLSDLVRGFRKRLKELNTVGLFDYIGGARIATLEQLMGELGTLERLSFYHRSERYIGLLRPDVNKEISEKNLSADAVIALLSDKSVMIPALNVQNPSENKWVSFSDYNPEVHRSDVFSVKRRERKDGRVSFGIDVETSVRGTLLASYFRIEGYKVL